MKRRDFLKMLGITPAVAVLPVIARDEHLTITLCEEGYTISQVNQFIDSFEREISKGDALLFKSDSKQGESTLTKA